MFEQLLEWLDGDWQSQLKISELRPSHMMVLIRFLAVSRNSVYRRRGANNRSSIRTRIVLSVSFRGAFLPATVPS